MLRNAMCSSTCIIKTPRTQTCIVAATVLDVRREYMLQWTLIDTSPSTRDFWCNVILHRRELEPHTQSHDYNACQRVGIVPPLTASTALCLESHCELWPSYRTKSSERTSSLQCQYLRQVRLDALRVHVDYIHVPLCLVSRAASPRRHDASYAQLSASF